MTNAFETDAARVAEAQCSIRSLHEVLVSLLSFQCFNCQLLRIGSIFRDHTPDGEEAKYGLITVHGNMEPSAVQGYLITLRHQV